ncbi:MAG: hypothetical protein KDK70_35910, partial [Myxococcales bacterium]|nr:hypothetical protein [Myxococcales bacterium]
GSAGDSGATETLGEAVPFDPGCNCTSGPSRRASWPALALLGLGALGRRRRRAARRRRPTAAR